MQFKGGGIWVHTVLRSHLPK